MKGKNALVWFLGLAVVGLWLSGPAAGQALSPPAISILEAARRCMDNDDCGASAYCAKRPGDCDGMGRCKRRPVACPEYYQPVCGCDGRTYDNKCFAAAAGTSVEHEGTCETVGACCLISGECLETTEEDCIRQQCGYYQGNGTQCDGLPFACPIVDPIPGACCLPDGSCTTTFQCFCERDGGAWQGFFTFCETLPYECPPGPRGACCLFVTGECVNTTRQDCLEQQCGAYQGNGTSCETMPSPCPIIDPIPGACCLADGTCEMTFECDCNRRGGRWQGFGSSCATAPDCGQGQCRTNADCSFPGQVFGEFCKKAVGDCDGFGTCQPVPQYCLDVWIPVCGCDGQTYSNGCYANRVGVNVAHEGACGGGGIDPVEQ